MCSMSFHVGQSKHSWKKKSPYTKGKPIHPVYIYIFYVYFLIPGMFLLLRGYISSINSIHSIHSIINGIDSIDNNQAWCGFIGIGGYAISGLIVGSDYYVSLCITVYYYVFRCITMCIAMYYHVYCYVLICIIMHYHVFLCITTWYLVCVTMYYYVLPCFAMHYCALLCANTVPLTRVTLLSAIVVEPWMHGNR